MELTLLLPSAEAAKPRRLSAIKAALTGRTRGQAVRIVWHDSLDRALARRGLALAEQRGCWHLERHRPGPTEPWAPATDHRTIQSAETLEALRDALDDDHALPEATTPVAAFDGRRTVCPLSIDGAPVLMTVLDGVLRTVAAERPAARLILTGPDSAVQTLALSLADALSLTVPENSLAAEAVSLADGPPASTVQTGGRATDTITSARRRGAPSLPHDGFSVREAFGHVLGHLTDVMLQLAPLAADPDTGPEPVHQMRVAVRRARSAFSVFPPVTDNPSLTHAEAGLKELGHVLGPARDWDVFMTETVPPVEAALADQTGLRVLLRAGARRRKAARAALGAYLTSAAFRLLTIELACFAASVSPANTVCVGHAGLVGPLADGAPSGPLVEAVVTEGTACNAAPPEEALAADGAASDATLTESGHAGTPMTGMLSPDLTEFAAGVLQKRWKRLRNAGKALDDLDNPGLHGLRLKAKRLRYAAEFFAPLFPEKPTARFIARLAVLQERLGLFNDTAVAETLLRELSGKPGYAAGLVLGFTAARGSRARPKIAAAWTRFRRREAFWVA